ncbi:acid phosphatase 1-like [Cucurbita pepo subsp. pepo]|uniref:acid phosphatase 1-like n=1 Tax=Cucurbita pepo subsp. pepo TaxID=3664 RepID=UPI000C9D2AE7|nr:acid phosphatase 1-like [Cucurbita pepo subsp. pepo]
MRFMECRGKKLNITDLEAWMSEAKAPVLGHTLRFFNLLKAKGVDIILISARREALRSATIENLVQKGYHGWSDLFFRSDEEKDVEKYKSDVRRRLVKGGYCIWGILGDQYSSLEGTPSGRRTFKLPNPMYYAQNQPKELLRKLEIERRAPQCPILQACS